MLTKLTKFRALMLMLVLVFSFPVIAQKKISGKVFYSITEQSQSLADTTVTVAGTKVVGNITDVKIL